MKLSISLCKQHLGRMFKSKWRVQSQRQVIDVGIPSLVQEQNVPILNALDVVKEIKSEVIDINSLPEPLCEPPRLRKNENHPDWKENCVLLINRNTRLIEGEKHILHLTKTISYSGLPLNVKNLLPIALEMTDNDLVQRSIMEALVWDATQVKLPKRINKENPGLDFPREYGIPHTRKVTHLLYNLVYLCQLFYAKKNGLWTRTKITDAFSKVFLEKEGKVLLFRMPSDVLTSTSRPLSPFATKEQVESTKDQAVPDIFPLHFSLDLQEHHIYTSEEIYPLAPSCLNCHFHTLHITHNMVRYWHQPQKLARAVAVCFTFAAAQARQKFGPTVKELTSPVCVQCAYLDGPVWGFLGYQLNTLNINSPEGIKNQVWIDGPYNLYESCDQASGIQGYNSETFSKFLSLHLNET
ncbi:39S ribosomal protein L37, mitochondrial-like isoform X2 [Limulus polyphemus]|nr:39S ribosomal protein L37, mitochondrial-like isoform X2 [Limulus polyphemus]XP_022239105.1 39S ribosomal protein L37, mitochondrial-like isoform X2 [Limulus polyphemus]